jgi:hypothetical protein
MYEKPKVERFGSFRELTQGGWGGGHNGDKCNYGCGGSRSGYGRR